MDAPHIWIVGKCIHNDYYYIVLYCIVYYKFQLLLKVTFKLMKYLISISKTRPFKNDIFFILIDYLN